MDAIFFVLRTGCQWNALRETTICSSSSAHRRFQEWVQPGCSRPSGAKACWPMMPYRASTGTGWRWTGRWARRRWEGKKTGPNPTDRGKRGVKRSILTDGRGVPLGAVIDGANRNDHKLMRQTIEAIPIKRPKPTRRRPQHLCLDKGFDYDEPRALADGVRLHLASAHPRRGGPGQASCRSQSAPLGGGANTLLAQPLPQHPDPLGQEARQLSRAPPLRLRHHHLAARPTGIGSKQTACEWAMN